MTTFVTRTWKAHAAGRARSSSACMCLRRHHSRGAAEPPKPPNPQKQPSQSKPQTGLRLNDREYFETRGLNVLVFTNQYNGMFFDEKTAGIEIIQNGIRMATGGAVRLSPTPEQWDQIPKVIDRKVDKTRRRSRVCCATRPSTSTPGSSSRPKARASALRLRRQAGTRDARRPAGFNLEFLPSAFFEHTYLADGKPGSSALSHRPDRDEAGATKIQQFEGYSTFDDRGRSEYVRSTGGRRQDARPRSRGRRTPHLHSGRLRRASAADGRNLAQNGWFIVRSLLSTQTTGKVAEWVVRRMSYRTGRGPVIGFSQAGYHPTQKKVAVIELDSNDTALPTASLFEVTADGQPVSG